MAHRAEQHSQHLKSFMPTENTTIIYLIHSKSQQKKLTATLGIMAKKVTGKIGAMVVK